VSARSSAVKNNVSRMMKSSASSAKRDLSNEKKGVKQARRIEEPESLGERVKTTLG